jgi:glycosyltransferase involved in cell wall biosynthesis
VDVDRYRPRGRNSQHPSVIGWMGSPSTAAYVAERALVWERVTTERDCMLRLVGAGAIDLGGVRHECVSWREEREIADLQGFDIGIMPLRDDPWSRGKCGFKLIQYMACGLPVVASPVGVNRRIVEDGTTGFLCECDDEWVERVERLADTPTLRAQMGGAARAAVERNWSFQRWGEPWVAVLREAARR